MSDTLPSDDWNRLTARADRFQHALVNGGVTDFAEFLDGLVGVERLKLLTELVARELRHRWAGGERPRIEEYLTRFPELAPGGAAPPALIIEEYRCRIQAGEHPDPLQFLDRFPDQFDEVQADLVAAAASGTVKATSAPQLPPTARGMVEVAQQYELIRELGRGMFGEVWLARKKPSGIERAIKILHQAADREAGQRELVSLELIKNLQHPYILATEDFWVTENRLHIVMELAEGTLRGRLKQCLIEGHPGVPAGELFRYVAEAAEGLDFLHAQHVVHRDVKPDNILILHGHAKVADFGLARAQAQGVESMSLAGTPAYMAPEIWGGEGGAASDLYSLAFAYVELRQGCSPLKPCPFGELMLAHYEGRYEFSEVVTEPERAVLRQALAAKPHERYRCCTDFVAALSVALGIPFAATGGQPAAVPPLPSPPLSGGSVAAFASSSRPAIDTATVGGTVVIDSLPKKPRPKPVPEPAEPEALEPELFAEPEPFPRRRGPLVVAATLALVALVTVGAWALFNRPGGVPTSITLAPPTHQPLTPTDGTIAPAPRPVNPRPPAPQGPKWVFPAGTTPDAGTKEIPLVGKTVPEWVTAQHHGKAVRFRLISGPPGPPVAFYISETKVTNAEYRAGGDDTPVVNVTATDAQAFARSAFNGSLPTAEEWDHAAGFYEQQGQEGPTRRSGTPWVNRATAGPVRRPGGADISYSELLDMAGNGREWTRTVLNDGSGNDVRDVASPTGTEKVVLRGRNFALDRPLTFKMLEAERTIQPLTAPANRPSPFTSFRVVLKVP
ncbi:protein kinase [Gemmata sp. JC673]|uniref:Protein kinase n=1 Tax=Gemmata algarum TaxID=2975278 RepID=A0ABU5EXX3_9BACT|nr:protein kinase [Gemmata algarum]MDY3560026.1 protein kinase [Gemmata algarum]